MSEALRLQLKHYIILCGTSIRVRFPEEFDIIGGIARLIFDTAEAGEGIQKPNHK